MPRIAALGAGENLTRRRGQHLCRAVHDHADIVDIGVIDAIGDGLPGVAAIGTAPHPVNLDSGPNDMVIGWIHGELRHPWNADVRALRGHFDRQFPPAASTVPGAEKGRGSRARKDDLWVDRIYRDLPNLSVVHRR